MLIWKYANQTARILPDYTQPQSATLQIINELRVCLLCRFTKSGLTTHALKYSWGSAFMIRTFFAVLVATIVTAVISITLTDLYRFVLFHYPLSAFDLQNLGLWTISVMWIFIFNVTVALPVINLLRYHGILRRRILVTAGAVAGFALYGVIALFPDSDGSATQSLIQQLAPWFVFGISGALSASVLGYFLIPSSNSTVESNTHKSDSPCQER